MKTKDLYQGYEDDLKKEERLSAIIYACFFLIIIFIAFALLLLHLLFFEIDRIIDSERAYIYVVDIKSFQSLLIQ